MKLKAENRTLLGKKVKTLRAQGLIPAVIFGNNEDSTPITVNQKEFIGTFKEVGETGLVEIEVGKDTTSVLIRNYTKHSVTGDILHVDMFKVNLKEKTTAIVPIIFEGIPEMVKEGDAILLEILNEIEVECLPMDIPKQFIIDTTVLKDLDAIITVSDLNYDKSKVEILDHEENEPVAKLDYAVMEEESEEEISEAEAIEGIETSEEKAKKEGEEENKEGSKEKPSDKKEDK
jgi:large subunit ribosomal protein L25